MGIGIAASIIGVIERLAKGLLLTSFILASIGLLRIITRATFYYFENMNAQKRTAEAVREPKVKPIEEAEVVKEK